MTKIKKQKKINYAKTKRQKVPEISAKQKRIYWIILILIPIIVLTLLEVTLRLFNYGIDTKLFVPTPNENSVYYGVNLNVGRRYFTEGSFNPSPRKDLFLRVKPEGSYRIFILGGSTTAGFPYGNNVTFPRILHRRLLNAYPNKKIEVVNLSMTAINSYTMLDFMDEVLEQQPDLILIYAGHNEFYGALGVSSMESLGKIRGVVKLFLNLQSYKTYGLIRNITVDLLGLIRNSSEENKKSDKTQTEMAKIVGNKEIPLGGDIYELGKKQFYENLTEIFEIAKNAGVKVLVSELVSNIRDQKPFVSIEDGSTPSAYEKYNEAKLLESKEKFEEAKKAYYSAKDLDALRFRATEEFNEVINSTANKFDIPVVPMKKHFEQNAANRLVGNSLMHEHLHPKYKGYFVMANAYYKKILNLKIIEKDELKTNTKSASYYYNNWGYTKLDSTYAALNIMHLKSSWPFEKSGGPNLFLQKFHPKTKEETVSCEILQFDKKTLELGHIELAKYFAETGNIERAIEEHKALIYTVPYLDLFYEDLIKLLLEHKKFNYAEDILIEAVRFNESAFIYKWLGQVKLVLGKTEEGIKNLEKSHEKKIDESVIANLASAYYNQKNISMGDKRNFELKRHFPNSQYISVLAKKRNTIK